MTDSDWGESSVDIPAKTGLGRGTLSHVFGEKIRGIGRGSVEGSQSNAFGSRNTEVNDSSYPQTNGYGGNSRGSYGNRTDKDSRGGFGGNSNGGFGSRTNEDSRGGFGGNSNGGFGNRTKEDSSGGFGGNINGYSGSGFGGSNNHRNDHTEDSESSRFGGSRGGDRGGSRGGDRGGSRGGARGGSRGGHETDNGRREGDWMCPNSDCGNKNFAFRKCCQKCETAKPDNGNGSGDYNRRGGDRSGADRNERSGDWVCPDADCGNRNFAFRSKCQKCDTPKPQTRGDDSNKENQGGRTGGFRNGGFGNSADSSENGTERNGARRNNQESGDQDDQPREAKYIPPTPSDKEEDIFSGTVQKGINFDKYDDIPVEVSGRDQCGVITSFDEAGFYPTFLRNLKRANFERPTPIQKYSIPVIMGGRDLMACAQTGSGKTAAFLLPVLTAMINQGLKTDQYQTTQTPQAICVAPTRELALQIYNDCRKFAYQTEIRVVVVYGGTSMAHQMRQIESGAHIVIGTPGRLLDFVSRRKISVEHVSFLILDEADRMLDMGFEPEMRKLIETFGMPAKTDRQTLMFSATFPEEIQKLAADFLNDYLFVTVGRVGGANTDVSQHFFEVERLQKRDSLCDILNAGEGVKTLVFVEMKRNADFLASFLCQSGFPTTSIHGDRLQREREEALADFKSGKAHILVATSVAARGLDIPEVMHVVNYDLPASIDEYVHRIGRTGRCGNLGKATSFFSADSDQPMAHHLVKVLKEASQQVPDWLAAHACGMGAGDAGNFSARFGGKDIRRGKFGGGGDRAGESRSGDNWASGSGANIGTVNDDEGWD